MSEATVPFPRTGAPALRALASAGYEHLQHLDGVPMRSVLDLHGMGPKGIGALREAMAEHGWAFAQDDPRVGAVKGDTKSHTTPTAHPTTGRAPQRNDNATGPTSVDPAEWVESLPNPRRREQGRAMLELFGEVTGAPAVMWGPSIVGYGEVHYAYESGREGDMARIGFSPRSTSLSLYGLRDATGARELLDRLGPHEEGAGCVYVTRLADIDLDVLRELVRLAWEKPDG